MYICLQGPTGCELMLPYGRVRPTLAKGTVFPLKDGLIHSVPFEAGHLRVSVDRIYEEKYHSIPLPVSPDDEICVLGDALHSYIQWPGDSIRLTKPPQKDKNRGQTLEATTEKVFTFSSGFMFSFSKSCFFELLLFINFTERQKHGSDIGSHS